MTLYTIVGAGAIGGTLGAYMLRGGVSVQFVDTDANHVDSINQQGLTIRGYDETFTVEACAMTPDQMPNELERVVLAVKAPATAAAMRQIAPKLAANGCVISAQNGLNEIQIAETIGAERTIGCFINFSADYLEPGLIHFGGPGAFYIGELDGSMSSRLAEIQRDFSHWGGGQVHMTDNIWGFLWGKQAYGAVLFSTALSNESMGDAIDAYRPLAVGLAREVISVAHAEGIQPQGFDGFAPELIMGDDEAALHASLDRLVAVRNQDEKKHTGVWRDLAIRKRRTEVDEHFPPIMRLGEKHGIQTPLLSKLVAMVHEIEDGNRPLSTDNLDELQQLATQ